MDTFSSEVTAHVEPCPAEVSTPGSAAPPAAAAGRDSPRPVVVDVELGRRLSADEEDDDDAQLLPRLTTMPRPDTPSNVW